MYNFIDNNSKSPFDKSSPGLDMAHLQALLRQQALRRPLYENIAILGCGYVGTALAACWQEQGHFVTGTTTRPERVAPLSEILSRVVLMQGEDMDAMRSLVQGQDTIVVSVAPLGSQVADEVTYKNTYLSTAQNLVEALNQAPSVKQVIYLSSCSIYGDRQGVWVDETTSISPTDLKSQMLYEAEKLLLQAAIPHLKVCILRLGGIYGPGRELVRMFGGLPGLTLPGRGESIINWIHRDDIAGVVEFARLNQLDGIYNLADDSKLTLREQLERVCSHYGLPSVQWDTSRISFQRKSLRVSNRKLKAAGYQLIHPQLLV